MTKRVEQTIFFDHHINKWDTWNQEAQYVVWKHNKSII